MKEEKLNNPLAFATCVANTESQDGYLQEGMTLLDYFAGQALQGILSADSRMTNEVSITSTSYRLASLMLKERKKYL